MKPPKSRSPGLHTRELRQAYTWMRRHFGHQQWWPGDTPFEVCVGAILTQNTNWTNVEKAISRLKAADRLDPARMLELPHPRLADLIRPAGYFNIKAQRLRHFLNVLVHQFEGSTDRLLSGDTAAVRARLLAIHGIGPETADSMLLYASTHLSFVVDAYTRRIFARHGWCQPGTTYDELKQLCEHALQDRPTRKRLDHWRDYHAQIVNIGKDFCRKSHPRCPECPLRSLLPQPGHQQ